MTIFLAVILGFIFGFVLQKTGAASPQSIIDMLRLKDFHLMKAILLGIGLSSAGLFILLAMGIVDSSHMGVKASYVGVIVGGGLLGLGWAVSGFCPGTSLVAVGAGRKDALAFLVGGLAGAFIYMLAFEYIKSTALLYSLGGKVSLASTGNDAFPVLLSQAPSLLVAGAVACVFIIVAWKLPDNAD